MYCFHACLEVVHSAPLLSLTTFVIPQTSTENYASLKMLEGGCILALPSPIFLPSSPKGYCHTMVWMVPLRNCWHTLMHKYLFFINLYDIRDHYCNFPFVNHLSFYTSLLLYTTTLMFELFEKKYYFVLLSLSSIFIQRCML